MKIDLTRDDLIELIETDGDFEIVLTYVNSTDIVQKFTYPIREWNKGTKYRSEFVEPNDSLTISIDIG